MGAQFFGVNRLPLVAAERTVGFSLPVEILVGDQERSLFGLLPEFCRLESYERLGFRIEACAVEARIFVVLGTIGARAGLGPQVRGVAEWVAAPGLERV